MVKTYILAGNHAQALDYCATRGLNHKEYPYIHHGSEQLRGTKGAKVLRVGTWYQRTDIDHIEGLIVATDATVKDGG